MGNRHQAREAALGYLYQKDSGVECVTNTPHKYAKHFEVLEVHQEFFFKLVEGVIEHQEILDTEITTAAEHWKLYRMQRIDRSILRLASWEIFHCLETDHQVIINEAVELAKTFGSQDSASFVNGILDRIARKIRLKEAV
jgi:N utilization substance protein B